MISRVLYNLSRRANQTEHFYILVPAPMRHLIFINCSCADFELFSAIVDKFYIKFGANLA